MTTNSALLIARRSRPFCALAATVALLAVAGEAKAEGDDGCRSLDGPFSSVRVPPPACASPVGLCTHGVLEGDLPALYDFTFATLQPANDPNDPTEFVYTGHSVVTTNKGTIQTNDSGVIHLPPNGAPAPFVTTATIAGGTGRYSSATGVFVASGTLDAASGASTGTFVAQICPNRDRH